VTRPGMWKRALRSVAGSLAEAMLMTEPVAYAEYRRCAAGMEDQLAPDGKEQVFLGGRSVAKAPALAIVPGGLIGP
jgi:hypothetical protein